MRQRQQGVALILAVMIVALITVVSIAIAERQQLDMRLTGNIIEAESSYQYALGAEAWGIGQIMGDQNVQVDHAGEKPAWDVPLEPREFEGAVIEAQIEDLHGRINLNNLIDAAGAVRPDEVRRLKKLLSDLGEDHSLTDALLDWIDANQDARPGGAEDSYYMSLDRPYSTANRHLTSTSELALIKGFDYKMYEALKDFVVALPTGTELNINTASAQVLATLEPRMSLQDGETLVTEREGNWFTSAADLPSRGVFNGRAVVVKGLGVKSNYFLVKATATLGRVETRLFSVLKRENPEEVKVIMRGQGVY